MKTNLIFNSSNWTEQKKMSECYLTYTQYTKTQNYPPSVKLVYFELTQRDFFSSKRLEKKHTITRTTNIKANTEKARNQSQNLLSPPNMHFYKQKKTKFIPLSNLQIQYIRYNKKYMRI